MNHLTIKPSKIQGQGVFTTKPFKKGETVINWEPCLITLTNNEGSSLPTHLKQYVTNNKILLSPNRYLNHSCNPNTTPKNNTNIAIKDIKENEEITTNYLKEKLPPLIMQCNCKHIKCKKTIKN